MFDQKFGRVFVRELPHLYNEFDDVATTLAFSKTPEAIEIRRHHEATIGALIADRTRPAQLCSNFLQCEAKHFASVFDWNALTQYFEVYAR